MNERLKRLYSDNEIRFNKARRMALKRILKAALNGQSKSGRKREKSRKIWP